LTRFVVRQRVTEIILAITRDVSTTCPRLLDAQNWARSGADANFFEQITGRVPWIIGDSCTSRCRSHAAAAVLIGLPSVFRFCVRVDRIGRLRSAPAFHCVGDSTDSAGAVFYSQTRVGQADVFLPCVNCGRWCWMRNATVKLCGQLRTIPRHARWKSCAVYISTSTPILECPMRRDERRRSASERLKLPRS